MNFIRFCVQRKVTVLMFTITILIFGSISWFRLDQEFMPELDFPQLMILTHYANASSQEVENLVTKIIEESVGTVKNVHRIHSISREGISIVTVEFLWGTQMDLASLNLREKVDLAKSKLPRDSGEPRIEKFNPFALPVLTLSLSGNLPESDLLALAKRPVAEILEKTRGVAAVTLTGGREREISVELDPTKLTARNLSLTEIADAIAKANLTYPAGTVKDNTYDYLVRVMGHFESVDALKNIVISMDREQRFSGNNDQESRAHKNAAAQKHSANAITLGSIADVKDTFAEVSSYSRFNGKPNISLSILKQAEANVVKVADSIHHRLPEIKAKLPKGVELEVVYDQSGFIRDGIANMILDCVIGAILAFVVLLIFLRSWTDALVVCAAIPISIAATFFMMDMKGLTINTVTLSGLAIGIGMLVDGAIVVQENIARHRGMGKSVEAAAVEGSSEVFAAVTGSVLTTVAVFFPFVFVVGIIGQVFGDLSWSVILSQMNSLLVAFTIVTLLSSLLGKKWDARLPSLAWIDWIDVWGERGLALYDRILNWALKRPLRVMVYSLLLSVLSLIALYLMPKALFPKSDGNEILLRLNMPVGTTLSQTNRIALMVEEMLSAIPDIQSRSVVVGSIPQEGLQPLGSHQSDMVLKLSDSRSHSTSEILEQIQSRLKKLNLAGGRILVFEQGGTFSFLGDASAPIVLEIQGHDWASLEATARRWENKIKSVPGLSNVRTSISEPSPELQLQVRRDAMANLSLSVNDLAENTLIAIKGKVVSKYHEHGKEVDIRLRLSPEDRQDLSSVEKIYLRSPLEENVPLGALTHLQRGWGPSEIQRYNQQRTILVSADLLHRSVEDASKEIQKLIRQENLSDIQISLTGESAKMAESFSSLKIVLILSIAFVFMIMAAEFESLWQPFIVLFTIPLSLVGMALGLLISGQEVSAMAGMGLILLAGIVVDNGIVLIDFVNIGLEEEKDVVQALREGCHTRLRPILMTASTTIIGMLPLALSIGNGASVQAPMAIVVVSGLFVSTILTLVVIPAFFVLYYQNILDASGRAQLLDHLRLIALGVRQKILRRPSSSQ